MANLQKLKSNKFTTTEKTNLYLDNALFDKLRDSMLASTGDLKLDTTYAFNMQEQMNGTESSQILIDHWHKVNETTDNYRGFYTADANTMLIQLQNSFNETDEDIADGLNTGEVINCNVISNKMISPISNALTGATSNIVTLSKVNNTTITKPEIDRYRDDFMSRYNVDEETMQTVDGWVEDYKATGNTEYLEKLEEYQNMSEEEWNNLTDEQYKEFTELSTLYAWSGYVVEHGGEGTSDIGIYKDICGQMTSGLYSMKQLSSDSEYVNASLDPLLASRMKTAMASLGANDCLAYNIISKVENDSNIYNVYDSQYQSTAKPVAVSLEYDESGFVSVNIEDSYVTDMPNNTKQFLAAGKDEASKYMNYARSNAAGYDNHGMTDDELIGMFQSVENPNDLKIMTNIATSDSDFKVNGEENAFSIDYWEDDASNTWNYSRGVSDTFSVALAQMGSTMLYRQDKTNYAKYVNATVESSVNGSNHNILLDIATGAGIYADMCSISVINDEEDPLGGGNDYSLKTMLNAASANYGAFCQLYEKFDDDVTYSDINVGYITYSNQTGDISFTITADTESGHLWYKQSEDDKIISIKSKVESGNNAIDDYAEGKQEDLKKEFERKRENLVVDSMIDLTGNINPLISDTLHIIKDSNASNSAGLVKDGFSSIYSDGKIANGSFSVLSTILDGIAKYDEMAVEYEKEKEKYNDIEKLNLYFNYNTGSKTVGLYDYDTIRKIQAWNKNGIAELIGVDTTTNGETKKTYEEICKEKNDEVYSSLKNKNEYKAAVVQKIAEDLCDESFDDLENGDSDDIKNAYTKIVEETGYTEDDIDNAMQVLVYGYSENGKYHVITDIPFDLQHACIDAIDENVVDLNSPWEDFYEDKE